MYCIIDIYIYNIYTGMRLPKKGVPSNHAFSLRVFHELKHPAIGDLPFLPAVFKTPVG